MACRAHLKIAASGLGRQPPRVATVYAWLTQGADGTKVVL